MERTFENLINGNLKDAKKCAMRHSYESIIDYAREFLGWTETKATKAAAYLKGYGSFQRYCDEN